MLRAYPGKLLDTPKRIYNYRISRARVTIENAFGILVSRWRILRNSITCFPENAEKIVLATIALHNFIKKNNQSSQLYCPPGYADSEDEHGNIIHGAWRNEVDASPTLFTHGRMGSNNASASAFDQRNTLKNYFMSEGKIERQNKIK